MKKIIFLFMLLLSMNAFSTRYLVDLGSGNTWTDPTASGGTRVNLTTAGAGGVSTTFAAWFNDKGLATPAFAGTAFVAGDEVWIAGGTYVVAAGIALKDGVNIYGGFAGTETAVSGRSKGTNAWDFNNATVIDFNSINPGTSGLNCAAAFANATVVDGLSITKVAKSLTTGNGGIGSIIGTITLQNCKFYANTFTRSSGTTTVSGGLYMRTGSSVLNSYFYSNQSLGGTGVRGGAITSAGSVTVKGCLIENNSATGNGGAITISSNTATHSSGGTFEDCIIRSNTAGAGGGGIYHNSTQNKTGDVLIKNCQITDNTAASGGAVEITGSANMTISLAIEGCTIARNTSSTTVGAVNISATPTTTVNYIKNCIFRDNKNTTSGQEGAALYSGKAAPVYNCVFANNTGTSGVYVSASSKVYNCTFANNAAIGLKLTGTSCEVKNNIFWNNTDNTITGGSAPAFASNAYSGATGADAGAGTITSLTISPNNTFISATSFTGAATTAGQITESNNSNWNLKSGCPAINAGTDLSPTVTTDILGNARPTGAGAVDMGAYETSYTTPIVTVTNVGTYTYNGSSQGPNTASNTGTGSSYTFSYVGTGSTSYTASSTAPTNAGTYTVTATVAANGNYNAASSSATAFSIGQVALTVSSPAATSKPYDGNNAAVITGSLSGILNSDDVTLTGTGTFASTGVGTGLAVTSTSILGGAKAANYTLTQPTGLTADITAIASPISADGNLGNAATLQGTDITVNSGVTLTVDYSVNVHSVTVAAGGKISLGANTLTASNGIILESDVNGTATLTGDNAVSNATVKQHVTAGRNWYMSSPVTSAAYTLLNRGNSVVEWNEITKVWDNVSNGNLVAGKGYIQIATAAQGTTGTINFAGTTNSGDVSLTLSRTESGSSRGFNLVGNPYPSYLDWSLVAAANSNVLPTLWLRTKNNSGAYVFATVNVAVPSSPQIVAVNTTTTVTKLIPPMQAYWVRLNTSPSTTTFTVTNEMRCHEDVSGNSFKAPSQNKQQQPQLRLQVSNGIDSDETLIYTNPNATNALDVYDSPKMAIGISSVPEIYTLAGLEELVINGLNSIPYDTEISLGFNTQTAGNFSMKASQITNFESGTRVILKDYINPGSPISTDLSDGSSYNFSSDITTNNTSRFTLIFRAPSVATGLSQANGEPWVTVSNGRIIINGNIATDARVEVFNALGQKIQSTELTATTKQLKSGLSAGIYVINLTNLGKTISRKIIVD